MFCCCSDTFNVETREMHKILHTQEFWFVLDFLTLDSEKPPNSLIKYISPHYHNTALSENVSDCFVVVMNDEIAKLLPFSEFQITNHRIYALQQSWFHCSVLLNFNKLLHSQVCRKQKKTINIIFNYYSFVENILHKKQKTKHTCIVKNIPC